MNSFGGFPMDSQLYRNTSTTTIHRAPVPIPSADHSCIRAVNDYPSSQQEATEKPDRSMNQTSLVCPPPPAVDIGAIKIKTEVVEPDSDDELEMVDPLEVSSIEDEVEEEPEVTLSDLLTLQSRSGKRKNYNLVPEDQRDATYYAMRKKNTDYARKSRQKKRKIDKCRVALIQELSDKVEKLSKELRAENGKVAELEKENAMLKKDKGVPKVVYYFIPTGTQTS